MLPLRIRFASAFYALNSNFRACAVINSQSKRTITHQKDSRSKPANPHEYDDTTLEQDETEPCASDEDDLSASARSKMFEDRQAIVAEMLRVNHAGELGARQIYAGQMLVLSKSSVGPVLQEMADQEKKHLLEFEKLVCDRRVRPTCLLPLWNIAGYALGAGTAALGSRAAMACTVAVEEVISEHYNDQVRVLLGPEWKEEEHLRKKFRQFRDEELEHKHTGIEHEAEAAPFYKALSSVIKFGCRAAIFASKRV